MLRSIRALGVLLCASLCATQAASQAAQTTPVFKVDANLQSIAVQVTDKQGRDVHGLSAEDFTLLEDGHPQKIAFFGAENQPVSLAVLLDSSSSMESSRKLAGARSLLKPLLHGNLPEDEIFLAPFTDKVGSFERLSADQRVSPPAARLTSIGGGTALYDALATSLCQLRTAANVRQAVVVITDGADQHSRLLLEQLIHLAQASKPQIFMIGFFDRAEYDVYRESGKAVTLVSGHEIDNPLHVFNRIAKETGAESFFPATERDLEQVIGHILGILQAEYTLAYYPQDAGRFRRIQVRVKRSGVNVTSRRSAGSEGASEEPVHFSATSCEVSKAEHPYPWEPHVTEGPGHTEIYQDDFSDARSGWPNRGGSRYVAGGYEMSRTVTVPKFGSAGGTTVVEGILAAYGPWWGGHEDFLASISMEGTGPAARGMVFRLNDEGCYVLLLSGTGQARNLSFKLVKRTFWNHEEVPLLPWTPVAGPAMGKAGTVSLIAVECRRDRIRMLINGVVVESIVDKSFTVGYVGMAQYGYGRTLFRDLRVEGLP